MVARARPVLQFLGEQEVVARSGTGDQRHPAKAVTVGERAEYHRTKRRQPDPAGDDDQVATGGLGQPPVGAERATHPDHGASLGVVQGTADRADRADRVSDGAVGAGSGRR